MSFGLIKSCYECRIGHVTVNLLNDQPFRAVWLVLIGTLRVTLLLVLILAPLIHGIPFADVSHDVVDRLVNTTLTRSRLCNQTTHQRGLVLDIIGVFEPGVIKMSAQGWEYRISHSGLIDARGARGEQSDQLRQLAVAWKCRGISSVEVEASGF